MRTLLLLSLCVAGTAFATPTKYSRNQNVAITAAPTHREPPRPKPSNSAGPSISGTAALEKEVNLGVYRGQQEAILKQLIRDTPDDAADEKAQYYFMLGELYAKQHRMYRLRSIEKNSAEDAKQAKQQLVNAVATYHDLVDNPAFRKFAQMDIALFYLAYTLQTAGRTADARKIYDRLLAEYPKSHFVADAHFAFAEYFFEAGQLADAEARYRKVLLFPASSLYWYAMYKLGWIQLNQKQPQLALETFFQIVQGAKQQQELVRAATKDFVRAYAEVGKADKAQAAFKRVDAANTLSMLETLADLYLDQGKSDRAIYVYRELMTTAPKHAHVCSWQYAVAQATLSLPGATTSDKVDEVERFVKLARAVKLPATEQQECRDNASAMTDELARAYHSEAARTKNVETYRHAERLYRVFLDAFPTAQDAPQLGYFYAELLWARADGEADARVKTELWQKTADAFTAVVTAGKVDAKLLDESAYAAVLAWKNALDVDPRPKLDLSDDDDAYAKVQPEVAIPANESKLLGAIDVYLKRTKQPPLDEKIGLQLLAASTYRRYRHFTQALPLLQDVLAKHRDHEYAEDAAQLLLDTYNRMQRHDDMLALARQLGADKAFLAGKDGLAKVLVKLQRQGLRHAAEDLEKSARGGHDLAKYVACGDAFLAIYNNDPLADDNDEVLYNALICYHEGKSVGAALLTYGKLGQYYSSSKLYARATGRIGKAYGDIAFYDRAADKLEEYAKKYAGEDDAHGALSEAVMFRKGTGDDQKAIDDTKYFVKMFGKQQPQQAADAIFSLTGVYEKRGDTDALVKHLRGYLHDFGTVGGQDRRVIANAKIALALWHQSCPVKEFDGSCVKVTRERAIRGGAQRLQTQCGPEWKTKLSVIPRDARLVKLAFDAVAAARHEYELEPAKATPEARHFYAQVRFVEADRQLEAYLASPFPSNLDFDGAAAKKSQERFAGWMKQQTQLGATAKESYGQVLAIKDNATSIAAAARVAQIAQHLSDALFTAEIPKSVRTGPFAAEKVETFCDRLTELAEPLATTATTAYGECLHQSTRLGWFSEWSQMCERELGQINPATFPTATELRAQIAGAAPIVTPEPPALL